MENLNVRGMVKNRHLSKAILQNKPYYFKQTLIQKCTKHNIEIREVGRFYPSSKLCSSCNFLNSMLKLKDRDWKCSSCGAVHRRDYNAAVNLKNCKEYTLLNSVNSTDGLSRINACGVLKQQLVSYNAFGSVGNERKHYEARKSELVTSRMGNYV